MLRIYEKDLTADTLSTALATGGLGILTHATQATLHRVINGDWSLTVTCPLDAPGADLLTAERLICYEDDATGKAQLYRISRRTPRQTRQGRVIEVEAPHVAYDLRHRFIVNIETREDDRYPDGIDAKTALTQLLEGTGFRVGEVTVDLSLLDYLDILQKDVMTCLKDQLLGLWGGELEFDNFTIHLKAALGEDRRYPIRDGRNIREITVTENWEPVVTRLHVRGYENANFEDINGGKDYIDSELIGLYSHIREGYVDFDDVDDPEELMRLGLEKLAALDLPEITYDIRLAQMQGSVQYAAYRRLEQFGLGDTAVLHTDVLSRDVILRLTEVETDCLTGRNTSVKLGNTDRQLLASITAGASASDQLAHVLTPDGYLQAEKIAGALNLVRIKNLTAEIARIAEAEIGKANITSAQIKDLQAQVARIVTADIGSMNVDWAHIERLTAEIARIAEAEIDEAEIRAAQIQDLEAQVARIVTADIGTLDVDWANIAALVAVMAEVSAAKIGEADIDFARIRDLIADKSIFAQGEAGELYIADLAVTEANMVRLSLGQLLLRGADGGYYEVYVDDEGTVGARKSDVTAAIEDGTLSGGKIIEGSITADRLNAQDIFADNALIRQLMAANIDVDTLFSREATINAINAMDIMANSHLRVFVDGQNALNEQLKAWFNFSAEGELAIGRSDQAYSSVVRYDGFAIRYYSTDTLYFKKDTGYIPKLQVDEKFTIGGLTAEPDGDYIVWA